MATKYIQAPEAFIVTGIGTSETQITLSNFKTISGDLITQSMIGGASDYIPMTLSPRTEREEQIRAKVNSVSGDNVILDIIRAVNPVAPYDDGGGIPKPHNVNDTAVISNNPVLLNKLTAKDNNETITANWTFSGNNTHNGEETFTDIVDVTGGVLKVADAVANDEPYTKLQTDLALALKANANATVNLTGNQTVAGVKTFSSSPVVPTAVNPTDAINKSQVEAFVAANSGNILASDTAFGTTKLDVAADTPADPKALTATANRVAALSGGGDFGTPSASNKFLTDQTRKVPLTAGETINGATTPVPVFQNKTDNEFYACDANDNTRYKFIGFAVSNGTNGNPINVQFSGVVSGFTGLAEGEKYYVQDTVGTIGTTPGTQEILVGVAISETQLVIQKNSLVASGDFNVTPVDTNGSQAITLGFRPSFITLDIVGTDTNVAAIFHSTTMGVWSNNTLSGVSEYLNNSNYFVVNGVVRIYRDSGQYLTFTITSVTDTGFTVTWTETGNMAAIDSIRCLWSARGN